MASTNTNTNGNANANVNANTNACACSGSDNFSFWESRVLMAAVAPDSGGLLGGLLHGLLQPSIAKLEPALPEPEPPTRSRSFGASSSTTSSEHVLSGRFWEAASAAAEAPFASVFLHGILRPSIAKAEPAHQELEVAPLRQSPSMVRRSAMMAMGVYSHALPEVRTMGAEANESRGLLDRQLREQRSCGMVPAPPAAVAGLGVASASSPPVFMDGLSGLYSGMANQGWR